MARKPVDPVKVKARKQKKIAIGGGVLLLLLVAIQGPKLLKQVHGGSQTPAWLAQSRQGTAGGAAPAAPATDPNAAPAAPTGVAPVAATGSLVADSAPPAGPGQLATFDGFASKDPFDVQVPAGGATGAAPAGGAAPGSSAGPPRRPAPPSSSGTGGVVAGTGVGASPPRSSAPAPPLLSAVIAVNGVDGLVAVGSDFPAASPFFHLVSATAHSAKITIAGGSYASGAASLTLRERKPVTLMNTADGTRYTLELLPQGTPVAAAAATAATGPTSTTQSTTAATTTSSG